MLLCDFLVLASLTYFWYNYYLDISKTVLTGKYEAQSLFVKYDISSFLGNHAYLEPVFEVLFFTSIYSAMLFTSLSISFMCLHLGNEFDACAKELSYCVKGKNGQSISHHFQEIKNRFHDLEDLVGNVTSHFSFYIGLNIMVCGFVLCTMSYSMTLFLEYKELPLVIILNVMIVVVISSTNVLLLTLPVSSLHTKVSIFYTSLITHLSDGEIYSGAELTS